MLLDEKGHERFIVKFRETTAGISKEETAALSSRIAQLIDEHGLDVPDRSSDLRPPSSVV
jgi:hypothetical protein